LSWTSRGKHPEELAIKAEMVKHLRWKMT